MKLFVVLANLALVSVAIAAPQAPARTAPAPQEIQLLQFESDNDGLGNYRYSFEQSDGQKRDETGELRNAGTEDESIAVKGSFTWADPDGVVYTVTYIADVNGFQPTIVHHRVLNDAVQNRLNPNVIASLTGK